MWISSSSSVAVGRCTTLRTAPVLFGVASSLLQSNTVEPMTSGAADTRAAATTARVSDAAVAATIRSLRVSIIELLPECASWYHPRSHESNHSLQVVFDDGAGVLHLGRLVSPDLRLPAEPRLQPDRAKLDSQHLPGRRHRRHVLQQPVRGPELRRGAVPVGQPPDRRRRDAVPGLDAVFLAV